MFIIGNLVRAVAQVIDLVLTLYMWIIIARAVLSWVSPDPYNPIVRFIHKATEPVLSFLRRRLPLSFGAVDFTPIIVLVAIVFLKNFIVANLEHFGQSLLR
jgi:YggT family protein